MSTQGIFSGIICKGGGLKKGFTLVEVIMIIAIISILGAVAIPALTGYVDKADETEIKQHLATCVEAIQTWGTERYADDRIGQGQLVFPVNPDSEDPSHPAVPYAPSFSPYKANNWLSLVDEYSNLNLSPSIWSITEVRFDDRNKLVRLALHRNDFGQTALYTAEGVYNDGGGGDPGGGGGGPDPPGTSIHYDVVFDSQGGSAVATQRVLKGSTAVKPDDPYPPSDPSWEGYSFDKWCRDKAGLQPYDFSSPVTKSITLYAKWREPV
ncbi:MAG: InlB B-repeat-containing protein, partial [Clostridiales Family XIII bacterium]|nr:InlB B-repeat-containing protein [Clostridiales Family XIII bacterium]